MTGCLGTPDDRALRITRREYGRLRSRTGNITQVRCFPSSVEVSTNKGKCQHRSRPSVPSPDGTKARHADDSVERVARQCRRVPSAHVSPIVRPSCDDSAQAQYEVSDTDRSHEQERSTGWTLIARKMHWRSRSRNENYTHQGTKPPHRLVVGDRHFRSVAKTRRIIPGLASLGYRAVVARSPQRPSCLSDCK